ncbi:MAG: KamA family radical SAM protein [Candidatus Syntrophoarchaeum sp. WYZ-LMO15]|nr:MAG: KamA family radical SAM protein [Candidatus Syntrophoarchaeum sp. WYZ-LMO15]
MEYGEVCETEWGDELGKNISTIEELKEHVKLSPREEKQLRKVIERHPMSISRYYLSLIDWTDPDDPIRRMAVPRSEELVLAGSYDTSGELENTKLPGLQHKYAQTALILATNRCAMYCRHCFRKRMIGITEDEVIHRFEMAVSYIREHEEINNVLITGGDPFILSSETIGRMLEMLSDIEHLDFIRFGTRVPVTFPDRIIHDDGLLDLLRLYSDDERRIYVVTQFNHPREITPQSISAVDSLIRSEVVVNNQTVLLRGVNDDPETMAELQNRLVAIGVNPYYVFQCRPVKRVKHHFQVPLYRGYEIIEAAKKRLNGHSKRFKYIMSHKTGKIEIVGIIGDEIYLKYHQAKNPRNIGKFFKRRLNKTAGWLDELDRL